MYLSEHVTKQYLQIFGSQSNGVVGVSYSLPLPLVAMGSNRDLGLKVSSKK